MEFLGLEEQLGAAEALWVLWKAIFLWKEPANGASQGERRAGGSLR
jgi:hypothetical protein